MTIFKEFRSKFDTSLKGQLVTDLLKHGKELRTATLRILNGNVKIQDHSRGNNDWGLSWIQGDSKKREHNNKILNVLDAFDVKPLKVRVKVDEVPYDAKDYWLHPCSNKNNKWDEILPRARMLGWIGGRASPAVELCKRMIAMGPKCKDNIYLQRLKSYTLTVGEVAVTNKVANVSKININDCMSMKRFLVLMNAAWFYHDYYIEKGLTFGLQAFDEMVMYIFDDPDYHTKKLKGKIWNTLNMAFSLSTEGVIPQWNNVDINTRNVLLNDYELKEMSNNLNNHKIFMERKHEVDEWMKECDDLPNTRAMIEALITAEVNEMNMKYYQLVKAVIGFSGYTRTEPTLSFLEQISADENAKKAKNPPYGPALKEWWKQFIFEITPDGLTSTSSRDKLPDFGQWIVGNSHLLTNRSSGGESVKFKVKYSGKDDDEIEMKDFMFSDISKIFKYMTNPNEAVLWDNMKPMDKDNAGRCGNRMVVGGKPTRAIFLRRLSLYLLEAVFAIPLYHKQMHKRPKDAGKDWNSSDMYTVGNESGNVLVDHALAFFCTTQGFKFICELADFASFDVSQMYHNMRKFMQEGLVEGLESRGLDGPWATYNVMSDDVFDKAITKVIVGWEATLKDIAIKLTGEGVAKDAMYELPDGTMVSLDMLQSGELMTLAINNVTNEVNFKDFIEAAREKKLTEYFQIVDVKLMGDDFYCIYGVEESFFPAGMADKFLQLRVDQSAKNGLTIKKEKTGFSCCRYEYLKKEVILGMFIPLLHIQLGSTEREENPPHPVEWIRSFCNTIGTIVSRGGSHNLHSCYAFCTWIIQGGVRITGKSSIKTTNLEKDRIYYYPIAGYFTPVAMGGVGQIPWCMHGASKDGVIAMYCNKIKVDGKRVLMEAVNIAATCFKASVQGITRKISDNILIGNTEPRNIVQPGLKFVKDVLMPKSRQLSAYKAMEELKRLSKDDKANVMLGDLYYLNTPKRMVLNAIKNADSYRKLIEHDKTAGGRKSESIAIAGIVTEDVLKEFEWITAPVMEYVHIDELDNAPKQEILYRKGNDIITFHPCLDSLSKNLVLLFGPNKDKAVFSLSASNILNKLRRDRYFPTDIRSESIMELLVKPGIYGNEKNMTTVLLALGADPELAGQVSRDFAGNANRISIQSVVDSFSLNDQFMPTLSIDYGWILNNCLTNGVPEDSVDAYRLLMSLFIVIDGFQEGKFYKMRVNVGEGTYQKIARSLYGKTNNYTRTTNILFEPRSKVHYIRKDDYF